MKQLVFALLIFINCQLATAQYTKLVDMNGVETGAYPYHAEFYYDGSYLYGTTSTGGLTGHGIIFRLKTDGTAFSKIVDFEEAITGNSPKSGLISDGTYLYGTTSSGGPLGGGVIFKVKPDGSDFILIHEFTGGDDGGNLKGKLFYDGTYLYGLSPYGGTNSAGMIYKLKPDGSEYAVIFSFDGEATGVTPNGALVSDGTYLYGMTVSGGTAFLGAAFKVKKDGTGFVKIMDMLDDPNGAFGYGSLIYDGTYLYGMTNNGGEENRGTIFKMLTDGSGYQKLLDFNSDNGAQPLGSLILDGTTLYGMAELGGPDNFGFVFQIQTDGSDYQQLVDFNGAENGSLPFGTLIMVNKALFGMTNSGGTSDAGVAFRYGEEEIPSAITSINNTSIEIMPNPNNGQFNLNIGNQFQDEKFTLVIYNTMGQKVYAANHFSSGKITLNHSKPGIYIAQINSAIGNYTTQLVIE